MAKIFSIFLVLTIFGVGFLTGGTWVDMQQEEPSTVGESVAAYREPIIINTLPVNVDSNIYLPSDEEMIVKNIDEIVYWYEKVSPEKIKPFVRGEQYPAISIRTPDKENSKKYICEEVEKIATSEQYNESGVLLVLVQGRTACDYSGLAQIGGNWMISYGWHPGAGNPFPTGIILHELGHILGLPHAQSYQCPIMTALPRDTIVEECERDEYGDRTDPMGHTSSISPLGFNPHSVRYLNWGIDTNYTQHTEPGTYKITLYNDAGKGDKTISLPGNYLLSLRMIPKELRETSFTEENSGKETEGIYLYHIIPEEGSGKENSVIVPFGKMRQHGERKDHYINTRYNYAFVVNSINPVLQKAEITLIIAEKPKVRQARGVYIQDTWGPNVQIASLSTYPTTELFALYATDYSGIKRITTVDGGERNVYKPRHARLRLARTGTPREVHVFVEDRAGNVTVETITVKGLSKKKQKKAR